MVKGKIHATSEASALSGNGMDQTGTEITVEDGAELTATGNVAIYHPQKGTLTINGGVITGTSGIEAKAGETTVSVDGQPDHHRDRHPGGSFRQHGWLLHQRLCGRHGKQ